ncbi:MAG: ABC transporter substrate-binding protein [Anaerolineae bacterium]|jgi:branched-chain amino acid transport system substrate-binding protein|nr:ABC transporter substrate-binding protein [Anaerolineae bacterium]
MQRLRILILSIALGILTFSVNIAQAPTFRIGVIDEARGPIADGARLAVQQINDAGGIVGADGTVFRLELVIASPNDIPAAVEQINAAGVVAVLGPETTEQVLNNLPLLQTLNVPVITPAIGDTILASDASELLFRSRATEFLQGRALATYILEEIQATNVLAVQLDIASTASVIGFTTAATSLGNPVQDTLLLTDGTELNDLTDQIIATTPQVIAVYGPPDLAATMYLDLRAQGWPGTFAYNQAESPAFKDAISLELLFGVIGTTTWSVGAVDNASRIFTLDYVRAYGEVPTAIDAAAYDSTRLIALSLELPGELGVNLSQLGDTQGVQGLLRPTQLGRGELSDNVAVIEIGSLGGARVVARFIGGVRLPDETEVVGVGTIVPSPTPTPDGVVVTVRSQVQNVRTGPSTAYDVLGQLQQGEQRQVIGANVDFSWVAIEFRGQTGWLSTAPNLSEVFGDRSLVPVLAAPPPPTPSPATGTPISSLADLVVVGVSPNVITTNTTNNITVTIQNTGSQNAGPFAIATSFAPNNTYAAQNVSGLAAGATTTVLLSFAAPGTTGNFQAIIIADLNQQVQEDSAGEANNNTFVYNYRIDRPTVLNAVTLAASASIDLDGNAANDLTYTPTGLNTVAPCSGTTFCIGLLSPTLTWDTAHYDAITGSNGISTNSILNASLTPGTTLGVLTNAGNRVVLRVDSINPGISITFTYRLYQ